MKTLLLSRKDVESFFTMKMCMEAVEKAFAGLAEGKANMPQRTPIPLPDKSGLALVMPAHIKNLKALGAKVITASTTLPVAQRVAPFAEKHKLVVAMQIMVKGAMLALVEPRLPREIRAPLDDPSVRVIVSDPRLYVKRAGAYRDVSWDDFCGAAGRAARDRAIASHE